MSLKHRYARQGGQRELERKKMVVMIGILQFKSCHQQHWKASLTPALYHCRGTIHSSWPWTVPIYACYPGLSNLTFVSDFSFSHEV